MNTPLALLLTGLFGLCAAALDKHPIMAFLCTIASFLTMYHGWATYTSEIRHIRHDKIRVVDIGTEWLVYFLADHGSHLKHSHGTIGLAPADLPAHDGVEILEQRHLSKTPDLLQAVKVRIVADQGKTWLDKVHQASAELHKIALVRPYRGRARRSWDSRKGCAA